MVSKIIEMVFGLKREGLYPFLLVPLCAISLTTFHPATNLLVNPFDWTHFLIALLSVGVMDMAWRIYNNLICSLVRLEGREGISLSCIWGIGIVVWCMAGTIYSFNTMGMKTFAMSILSQNGIRLLTLCMFGVFTLRMVFSEQARMAEDEIRAREIEKKRSEEMMKNGPNWKGIKGI